MNVNFIIIIFIISNIFQFVNQLIHWLEVEPAMFITLVQILQTHIFDQLDKTLQLDRKNVLAYVYNSKVIRLKAMLPNQFLPPPPVSILYRGVLLCLN